MNYEGDCLVTMDDLRVLEKGARYDVKVRDLDMVRPESRGETKTIVFKEIWPADQPRSGSPPEAAFPDDPRMWMVNGHPIDDESKVYGFHGWLIEEITPVEASSQ